MATRRIQVSKLPLPVEGQVALGTLEDLVRRHPGGRLELTDGEVVYTAPKPRRERPAAAPTLPGTEGTGAP